MNAKLTICIVTKDRVHLFSKLLQSISRLDYLADCNWLIIDNSRKDIFDSKFKLFEEHFESYLNTLMLHSSDFISSRNHSVELVTTPYFTILDDDDILAPDFYNFFESTLESEGDFDFLSFGFERSDRLNQHDLTRYSLTYVTDKLDALNSFTNYNWDKLNRIYLSNGANIYRTQVWREANAVYSQKLSDDIYPVTLMYLASKKVINSNYIGYYVSRQNTVTSVKSKADVMELEVSMVRQYTDLLKVNKTDYSDDPLNKRIIKKGMFNSICQLIQIDMYQPTHLIDLYINS